MRRVPWGDVGGRGSSRTGRAQRRRCLPCAPPTGADREGKAQRPFERVAAPTGGQERGLAAQPLRGGCPAVALYQRLHRPVRGRLRRQAYRCDRSCASL